MRIRKVFKHGSSLAIVLPRDLLFEIGDYVKIEKQEGKIILERIDMNDW